ncbi:MAG TPA: SDR family NAD(P)-dependent oxidoreductase [Mycobacteriales bacterium]|nr:SDR family NAD(P)-dependent oxidoreductase [Mycobacteriales bacterium]
MTGRRIALVTGGTRGIGAAITERLVADGAHVIAVFARDGDTAAALQARIGREVTLQQADVADPAACTALVERTLSQHGRLDYLVNNAGAVTEERLDAITPASWAAQLAVNLSGPFFLSQAAMPAMLERRFGRIVNIGSVSASLGSPVQIAYASAKAGLLGLTRSLARVGARKGVTVNCVIPGSFDTDLSGSLTLTNRDLVTPMIPMNRWGANLELAQAVAFLVHDDAGYVTGQSFAVDGGMTMGH